MAQKKLNPIEELYIGNTVFRSVVDISSDAIVIYDQDGKITYCNNSFNQLTGVSLGLNLYTILLSGEQEKLKSASEKLVKTENELSITTSILNTIGEIHNVKAVVRKIIKSKTIDYYLATFFKNSGYKTDTEKEKVSSIKYESFFENSIDLLCIADTDGYFRLLNPEWERTLGYSIAELIGQRFIDFVHPDDVEKTIEATTQLAGNKRVENFVNRYRHSNGMYLWIEWRSYPIGNMIYASARNITDRKLAEEALCQSEEKYRLLFENMTSGFALHQMIYDENGRPSDYRYIEANPAFEKLTRLPAKSMIGKTIKEMVPDIEDHWIQTFGNVALTGKPVSYINYAKDLGDSCYDTYVFCPKKDKFAVVFNDITERINAENKLKISEEKFSLIYQNSPDAININRLSTGEFLEINESFTKIMGHSPGEIIGKTGLEANIWADSDERTRFMQCIQERGKVTNLEARYCSKDGKILTGLTSATVIKLLGEDCILSITRDITNRKQAEEALKLSEKRLLDIYNLTPNVIGITRKSDGKIIDANQELTRFSGYRRDEYFNKTVIELGLWKYPEERETMIKLLEEQGNLRNYEFSAKTKSGETVICLMSATNHIYNNEECLLWVIVDINDRKLAEEKNAQLYALHQTVLDTVNAGILYVKDRKMQWANNSFYNIFGYNATELFNQDTCIMYASEEGYMKVGKEAYSTLAEGKVCSVETLAKRKNGQEFFIELSGKAINPEKPQDGSIWMIVDIDERKKTSEALIQTRKFNDALIESVPGLVYIYNEEGKLIKWNKKHEEITGYTAEELRNKDIYSWFVPSDFDLSIIKDERDKVLKDGYSNSEANLYKKNGEKILFYFTTVATEIDGKRYYAGIGLDITERKLAEEKLANTAETLRVIIETIPIALFDLDTKGYVKSIWNPAAEQLLGWTKEEAIGHYLPSVTPDRKGEFEQFLATIQQGKTINGPDLERHKKDGSPINYSLYAAPIYDNKHTIIGNIAALVDITQRKKNEEIIRKKEAQFRGITQNIPGMVFQFYTRKNGETGLYYLSDLSLQYIGIDNNNLEGALDKLIAGIVEDERAGFISSITKAVSTVTPWEWEGRYIKPDSEEKYLKGISQPRYVDDELIFDGIIFDITASKLAEQELAYTRALLSTAFMQTPIPMAVISANDFTVLLSNDACREILGIMDEPRLIGKSLKSNPPSWSDFDPSGNPIPFQDSILALALRGIETKNKEQFVKRKDGTIRWESVSASSIRNADGEITAVYLVFTDITKRKQYEEALRESQKLLNESQRVAHIGSWEYYYNENKLVWNEEVFSIYGYKFQEIQPTIETFIQLIVPSEREFVQAHLKETYENKVFKEFECHILRSDGSERTILVLGEVSLDAKGDVYRTFGIIQDITERKLAEEKLRESEELYRKLIETSPDGISLTDLKGNVIMCNKRMADFLGYKSVDEIISMNVKEIIVAHDHIRLIENARKILNQERTVNEQYSYQRKDKTIFLGEYRGTIVFDAHGNPYGFMGIVTDITEKKKAEEALRKSEEMLAKAQEIAKIGSFELELETEAGYFSNEMYKLFGFNHDKGIPNQEEFLEAIHPDDRYLIVKSNDLKNRSDRSLTFEYRSNPEHGPVRYFLSNNEVVHDLQTKKQKLVGTVQDITERKLAEKELIETRERLQSFMDSATDAFSIWDKDLKLLDLNKNAMAYFSSRTKKDNFIGCHMSEFVPKFNEEEFPYEKYKKVVETGIPYFSEEMIKFEKTTVWLDTKIFKVGDGFGVVTSDITERKTAEQKIIELNQELEKKVEERTFKLNEAVKGLESFAYSVSHDLRAPIRHIDGFTKLLYSKISQPSDTIKDFQKKIETATSRMSSMIDSLLSFSRLGRKEIQLSKVALLPLIDDIITQLMPDTANRKIEWKIGELPEIKGDKDLLKLAFENLISNAIKYTAKVPKALIKINYTEISKSAVEISIKDNGIGFDMQYVGKLFGVFQRLHSNEEFDGVGIGLANVKQIIEKHGGSIRAEGIVNEGATFYITLPK